MTWNICALHKCLPKPVESYPVSPVKTTLVQKLKLCWRPLIIKMIHKKGRTVDIETLKASNAVLDTDFLSDVHQGHKAGIYNVAVQCAHPILLAMLHK